MALSLSKQQEKVKLSLKKVTKKEIRPVQVKLLTDVSYSMKRHYDKDGYMLPILQRSIALASIIDPDKVVQITSFSSEALTLGDFGVNDFDSIWNIFSSNKSDFWNGTNYACGIEQLIIEQNGSGHSFLPKSGFISKIFGKNKKIENSTPSKKDDVNLVIFITDGEDGGNRRNFENQVNKLLEKDDTYLMCVGSEGKKSNYDVLESIANKYSNVGFKYFENAQNLTDDDFYDAILSGEFGDWLDNHPLQNS